MRLRVLRAPVADATTVDTCTGMYKEAFLNVFGLIEDSGWALVREGEEDEEEDAPLEEVRLPPTQSADDGADAAAAAAGGAKRAAAATAAAPSAGATT